MGVGRLYLTSKKFIVAEGGLRRLVWMPRELKEAMREGVEKRAVEEGLDGFVDKIADETVTDDLAALTEHLANVDHPALKMDDML